MADAKSFPVRIASSTRAWSRAWRHVGVRPSQPFVLGGRFVAHRQYRQPSPASNKVSWAPDAAARGARRPASPGEARSWPRPGRGEQPGQLSDAASSIQHARCAQPASAQASSARRSRTSPRESIAICHACSGTMRSAVFSRSPSAQPTE